MWAQQPQQPQQSRQGLEWKNTQSMGLNTMMASREDYADGAAKLRQGATRSANVDLMSQGQVQHQLPIRNASASAIAQAQAQINQQSLVDGKRPKLAMEPDVDVDRGISLRELVAGRVKRMTEWLEVTMDPRPIKENKEIVKNDRGAELLAMEASSREEINEMEQKWQERLSKFKMSSTTLSNALKELANANSLEEIDAINQRVEQTMNAKIVSRDDVRVVKLPKFADDLKSLEDITFESSIKHDPDMGDSMMTDF